MNYPNLDKYLLRAVLFLFVLIRMGGIDASAQQAAATSITLHIDGLSTEERDGLNQQLISRGDARIAFACVPAGIIVLQATDASRSADSLRLRALPGLLTSVAPHRIQEQAVSLTEAEQMCDNVRNTL